MKNPEATAPEIEVPTHDLSGWWILWQYGVGGAFFGLFLPLCGAAAIYNLVCWDAMHPRMLVLSVLGLLLIWWMAWGVSNDAGGIRSLLIHYVGDLSGKHVAQILPSVDGSPCLHVGYRVFAKRFDHLVVRVDRILEVKWSAGQASDLAGRDVDDWQASMIFETERKTSFHKATEEMDRFLEKEKRLGRLPVLPSRHRKHPNVRAGYFMEYRTISPPLAKEKAEAFGLAFVEFLRANGVALVDTGKGSQFHRPDPALGTSPS